MQPGVTYPREVPPPDGLPPGWKAMEFAYKSGPSLGKTYVRFNSAIKKDMTSTVKKALERDALNKGLSQTEADVIVEEYMQEQFRKKERLKAEKESQGYLKGPAREEAISAFRSVYGELNGGLVGKLPGWRAESMYRETCGQTAVTYYNPEGRSFNTVKDVECYFGVRVQRGEGVPEIAAAHANVKTDDRGRIVNEARQEVAVTRTVEDVKEIQEKKKAKINECIALGAEQAQRTSNKYVPSERYAEWPALAVLDVPLAANGANEKMEGLEVDLKREAEGISRMLQAAGFKASTELLAVQGSPTNLPHVESLRGIFHARPGTFNGKAYFQQTMKHKCGDLACRGLYIYWSNLHNRWKIGPLDEEDRKAPYAYLPGNRDRPSGVSNQNWIVYTPAPTGSAK